jgi:hypothetical protein
VDSEPPRRISHAASNAKFIFTVPTPTKRVELALHTIHEEYPISLTDHNAHFIGNLLESGIPGELGADGAESGAGGRIARSAIASRPGASGGAARASVQS